MPGQKIAGSNLSREDRKVCEKFKYLLEDVLHITQAEAGERLGIYQNTLSRIVRGVNAPSCGLIINILDTFEINPYWFLLDKNEAIMAKDSSRYKGKPVDKVTLKEIADDLKDINDRLRKLLK